MRRLVIIVFAAALVGGLVLLTRDPKPSNRSAPDRLTKPPDPNAAPQATTARHVASDIHPLPEVLIDPTVLIEKDRRTLTVFSAGEAVKIYRIALGAEPIGDKEHEGDSRTPEGDFYICTKNTESQYHRALGISYPAVQNADRGLAQKMISSREYRQIIEALSRFSQPSWRTALGGEIMIHGGDTARDWTAGCIALADNEIEEVFDALPLGTAIKIVP